MSTWDDIQNEAEWLAQQFRQRNVDLAEVEKAGDYYISRQCNDKDMGHYLKLMATNPPIRSRRSQNHYRNIQQVWVNWRPTLKEGKDKARAWAWAVRLAKATRVEL